jgi:hypothetical protein
MVKSKGLKEMSSLCRHSSGPGAAAYSIALELDLPFVREKKDHGCAVVFLAVPYKVVRTEE